MKTMLDRRRAERRKGVVPIAFADRRKAERRQRPATLLLDEGASAIVDTRMLAHAELRNAQWHTWGTVINVLGVAVGLFSITFANRWGERLATYGIAFMAITVVIYALIRIVAGRWEEKAIKLGQGQSR